MRILYVSDIHYSLKQFDWLCGAVAGFSSGFIRRAFGYHVLADVAALAAIGLLVAAYVTSRRPAPPDRMGTAEPVAAGLD